MSGDVQMELWLHQYKLEALTSVLAEQGFSVEDRMQEMLDGLYAQLVPVETQREIHGRIEAERAAALEEYSTQLMAEEAGAVLEETPEANGPMLTM